MHAYPRILIAVAIAFGLMAKTHAATLSGTLTYNDGSAPLAGAAVWIYLDAAVDGSAIDQVNSDDNGEYIIANLSAGTYFLQLAGGCSCLGMPANFQFYVGPVIVSDPGTTTYNVTMTNVGTITVQVNDELSVPMNNQVIQLRSHEKPLRIDETNLQSSYSDEQHTNGAGQATLQLPPTTATTSAGQTISLWQIAHWFLLLNPPEPYANEVTYPIDPLVDGGIYTIQAVVGQPVVLEYYANDGTPLYEVNDHSVDVRKKQGDGLEVSIQYSVHGNFPTIYLDPNPAVVHQLAIDLSVPNSSPYTISLPSGTNRIMNRDLVVSTDLVGVSGPSVNLPPTVSIDGIARSHNQPVELEAVYLQPAQGTSGGLYYEASGDTYVGPDGNDGSYSLVMYESTRNKLNVVPRDGTKAPAEVRVNLPSADSITAKKGLKGFQLLGTPAPPPVFDLDIEVSNKMNRIDAGSPSQAIPGSQGTVAVPVASADFSVDPANDVVSFVFDRDVTVTGTSYFGPDTLSDGVEAQQYGLDVAVNPSAATGYVTLTATVNGTPITGRYVLEIVTDNQAGPTLKTSGTPAAHVVDGAFDALFPAVPQTLEAIDIVPSELPLEGYRIMEQAEVKSGGEYFYPAPYQMTLHFLQYALHGHPKQDLVVLYRDQLGNLTELPAQTSGPPTDTTIRVETDRLGLISLAIRDPSFHLLTPSSVEGWTLYQ